MKKSTKDEFQFFYLSIKHNCTWLALSTYSFWPGSMLVTTWFDFTTDILQSDVFVSKFDKSNLVNNFSLFAYS